MKLLWGRGVYVCSIFSLMFFSNSPTFWDTFLELTRPPIFLFKSSKVQGGCVQHCNTITHEAFFKKEGGECSHGESTWSFHTWKISYKHTCLQILSQNKNKIGPKNTFIRIKLLSSHNSNPIDFFHTAWTKVWLCSPGLILSEPQGGLRQVTEILP